MHRRGTLAGIMSTSRVIHGITEGRTRVANCFFVSDLHGRPGLYDQLWRAIRASTPAALFMGGDLLPSGLAGMGGAENPADFVNAYLVPGFEALRSDMADRYPEVFLIMGNDDGRRYEPQFREAADTGLWHYVHNHGVSFGPYEVFGYAHVPPTPFLNKDWERYDVSRYVPPGGVSPEQGYRSVGRPDNEIRYATIQKDLERLTTGRNLEHAIMLFHSPPYDTCLDRVGNDGRMIDSVPLDLHVGSIAIRRFIENRQPLLTLHGHIHESVRLTGAWRGSLGRTQLFGAAHDGPELSLVRFDPGRLEAASRVLM